MWQVIPGQDLRQRVWDDEHVVYNNLTGDTHLLTADTMHILHVLQDGPLDEAGLVAALRIRLDLDGEDIAADVATLLAELERIFLVDNRAC